MQKITSKSYILLFALALCWGPSYLFIKIALEVFHPISLALFRVLIASIILFGICKFYSHKLLSYISYYKSFIFMGMFVNALPFVLINIGEQTITSGLTAIVLGMIPIFTALLSHVVVASEKLRRRTVLGIMTAFAGLLIIYLPTFYDKTLSNETGVFLIISAALSYAVSASFAKRHLGKVPALVCAFYQLFFASLILTPLVLALDHPINGNLVSAPLIAAGLLAILGTAIAFFIYYESILLSGATFTSLNSLIIPIISVLLGTLILHESLTPLTILGAAMILLGVFKINPYFVKK